MTDGPATRLLPGQREPGEALAVLDRQLDLVLGTRTEDRTRSG